MASTQQCDVQGCSRQSAGRGLCKMHWARDQRNGTPGPAELLHTPSIGLECELAECHEPRSKRQWCNAHYIRWRRTGDPRGSTRPSSRELFDAKVKVLPGGCHEWTSAHVRDWPIVTVDDITQGAAKWNYEDHHGPVPDECRLVRLCATSLCVNPEHFSVEPKPDPSARWKVRADRLAMAESQPYDRIEIFEKASWTCHLCDQVIDKTLPGSHKYGPTLDHIIAVSDGGPDIPSNLAPAHKRCNSIRGNRPVEWARQRIMSQLVFQ